MTVALILSFLSSWSSIVVIWLCGSVQHEVFKEEDDYIEEKSVEFFYVSGENLSNLPHCASLSQVI